jgi:hypothetical protein
MSLSVYRTSKTEKNKKFHKIHLAKKTNPLKFTKTTEFNLQDNCLFFKIKRIKYCNNKTNTKFVILSNELGRIMSVIAEIIDTLENKVVKLILKIKIEQNNQGLKSN